MYANCLLLSDYRTKILLIKNEKSAEESMKLSKSFAKDAAKKLYKILQNIYCVIMTHDRIYNHTYDPALHKKCKYRQLSA